MTDPKWNLADFRRRFPGVNRRATRAMLDICNAAIRNGLTREEVADVLTGLSAGHPGGGIPTDVLIGALAQRAFPISEGEREALNLPTATEIAREAIDSVDAPLT